MVTTRTARMPQERRPRRSARSLLRRLRVRDDHCSRLGAVLGAVFDFAQYELIETEAVKNGLALAETKIKPKPKPRARPTKAASTSTSKGKEKATTSKKRAAKVVDSEEEAEEDDVDDDEEDRDRVDTKRGKGAKPPAKRRSKKASDP